MNTGFYIKDIYIENKVVVAPMAGITNVAFRTICKEFGAGLVVVEMISSNALNYGNEKTIDMTKINNLEHPVSIQIMGGNQEELVKAAHYVATNTDCDIIDINMGCPVNKVIKAEAGAKWLQSPEKIYTMTKAVVQAVDKPVTVKMRTGWSNHDLAIENAQAACDAGVAAVAMHGRTRSQMYDGTANWDVLAQVAKNIHVPFIGNGDIKTVFDAKRMLIDVGVDAIMIGRAVLGNPFLIRQINHYMSTGEILEHTLTDKIDIAREHLTRLVSLKGEKHAVQEFRSLSTYYVKGGKSAPSFRLKLTTSQTVDQFHEIFDNFLQANI